MYIHIYSYTHSDLQSYKAAYHLKQLYMQIYIPLWDCMHCIELYTAIHTCIILSQYEHMFIHHVGTSKDAPAGGSSVGCLTGSGK